MILRSREHGMLGRREFVKGTMAGAAAAELGMFGALVRAAERRGAGLLAPRITHHEARARHARSGRVVMNGTPVGGSTSGRTESFGGPMVPPPGRPGHCLPAPATWGPR